MSYSLDILEFSRLLELIGRNAQTPMGKEWLLSLRPAVDRMRLDSDLAAIAETIALNEEKQVTWSFSGLQDPTDPVAILKIRNASLEPVRMLELARLCNQALFARSSVQPEKEFAPVVWAIVESIPPELLGVAEKINKKILPGGEIDDSASPELGRIRRELNAQRTRLTRSLEAVMRSVGDAIQDELVTVRNERFVIPVKADFRGKVSGVAHGFSSSGQTVFIEPLEAIEANNEIQNLKGKEEREIARILSELTESLRENLPAIESAVEAVTELDVIKTKVEFARKFKAVVPELSDDGTLELDDARHPLLEENLKQPSAGTGNDATTREVVPSSFALTEDNSVMIISGANAGGKTVVLKTAGLLSLMAISGLPVPAKKARVPFYRSVLADIGDHQSLSANLSTFSSHMSNIAEMMQDCRPPSLVLLDEAGTGTDPEEGSALGVAIVDHFRRQGAQVIASTHYRGLKIYAANDPNVINASVEFDEKTLQPTYRLLIGLAGASSGIEIARRFGIKQDVIDNARQNLDISAQEAEAYLRKLQNETKLAEDLRIALEEEREATAMKYAGLEVEAVKKENARQKEFERMLGETVEAFDRQSKAFIASLEDKALKNRLEKERSARKAELNRAVLATVERGSSPQISRGTSESLAAEAETRPVGSVPVSHEALAIGSRVLTSFGTIGTIEKLDKDTAEILVGSIRLREKLTNLRPTQAETRPVGRVSSVSKPIDAPDASSELNLIGKTTAEAEYELDRFIDEAYIASLPRVRIIHGFGTGALKNYVHHFLKNHELVERFTFAPQSEGGHGATIADIKI
jgi:DNA mismatch repair protein MutS2